MGPGFVEDLPVGRFHGIGPATSAKMNRLGIETGRDLRAQNLDFLQYNFGKSGRHYYWISRGIDHREVKPDRIRKSVGAENTFSDDLFTSGEAEIELQPIISKVWRYCEKSGIRGRTVTLKVKYADFQIITRSRTLQQAVASEAEIAQIVEEVMRPLFPVTKGIRLLGVTLSSLGEEDEVEASADTPQLRLTL